jgi:hypothetical protein
MSFLSGAMTVDAFFDALSKFSEKWRAFKGANQLELPLRMLEILIHLTSPSHFRHFIAYSST